MTAVSNTESDDNYSGLAEIHKHAQRDIYRSRQSRCSKTKGMSFIEYQSMINSVESVGNVREDNVSSFVIRKCFAKLQKISLSGYIF